MKTTMDSDGGVVIPRDIRRAAGLKAGSEVDVDVDDDGVIWIQPARSEVESTAPVRKLTQREVNAVVKKLRREREKKILG